MSRLLIPSLLALAAGLSPAGALGQSIDFNGTRENVNPLSPPGTGRCSPPYFNTVEIHPGAISSTGTSNLGTFVSDQSHCIDSPPPTATHDGEFTYTFAAGDTITGTYTGSVAAGSTPGVFDSVENLVITGGTGRLAGATGSITGQGALAFVNGNGTFSGALTGAISATATTTTGNYATAYGMATAAQGDFASAFGGVAIANGSNATAIGGLSQAIADGATALGSNATTSGADALAAGTTSLASGQGAVALGNQSTSSALRSTAVGAISTASGIASTALGHNTQATALGATAVGVSAHATQAGATAVGRLATADFAGSTALGAGAATTAANQVALGGTGSAVRVGDIAASTAAQSGPVAIATVDANGVLGRDTTLFSSLATLQAAATGMQGSIDALNGQVSTLFDLRELDRSEYRKGVAAAVAMADAPFPSAPGRTSYVLNGAVFRGEGAVGGSIMHRFEGETPIALGVGFSFAGKKNNAFRAGIAGEF